MASKKDNVTISILSVALDEQRRFHDELTHSYDTIKSKTVLYIGAILAVLTFLYSGALNESKTMRERLFIPAELYGMLFYFFGLACIAYALFILIRSMRSVVRWEVYTDITEKRVVNGIDEELGQREYLQDMVDGYEGATERNLKLHAAKYDAIKNAFSPMVGGAIILIVLRFFQ